MVVTYGLTLEELLGVDENNIATFVLWENMVWQDDSLKVIHGTDYVTHPRTDFHVTYTFLGSVLLVRAFGVRMRSPATLLLAE